MGGVFVVISFFGTQPPNAMVPLPSNKAFLFGRGRDPKMARTKDMDSALNSALQKVEEVNHGNRALVLVEDGPFQRADP